MTAPRADRAHRLLAFLRALQLDDRPLDLARLTAPERADLSRWLHPLTDDHPPHGALEPDPVARAVATLRALHAAADAVEFHPRSLADLDAADHLLWFLHERISLAY